MATITEDYVSFETAKLLKEKGFNGDTASCYILEDSTHHIMIDKVVQSEYYESQDSNEHGHLIQAPTLQMAMKWLRVVHNLFIVTDRHYFVVDKVSHIASGFKYSIEIKVINTVYTYNDYKSYRQACEAAIKYCLENLI